MKRALSLTILLILMVSFFTVNAVKPKAQGAAKAPKVAKVEVYYFHFTRRCVTCKTVEAESQKDILTLYSKQYKSGQITFRSINLDDDNSKALAEKCKAEGQSLLVISGNKRYDLTEQGFMYARTNPDKLKQELQKCIDPLLN